MKILFLHLSDLHIRSNSQVNLKVDKIISAVNAVGVVDKNVLICSGDLAYSGAENEYKSVKRFFGVLLKKLGEAKNCYIESYFVPGNHDIAFPPNVRGSKDILCYFEAKDVDNNYQTELSWLENFFEYVKSKNCYKTNSILDSKVADWGNGYKVQINMINTAPFSTLRADSKEIHYLPDNSLYSLTRRDGANLSITIMHHSPEWFHWKSKKALDSVLRRHTDILFQGHEHEMRSIQTEDYLISKGGEFSGEFTHESTFSILVFDTGNSELTEHEYQWNADNSMFIRKHEGKKYTLPQKNCDFSPMSTFLKAFFSDDQKISDSILDYFVFPKLYRTKVKKNEIIKLVTEDALWQKLKEQKVINITGKSGYGKTFLLKYLYNQSLEKDFIPLFLGSGISRKSTADRLIKSLFSEQYGDDAILFECYEQADISRKILLIDDLDMINLKETLLQELSAKVRYIVFSSQNVLELDVNAAAREEIFETERHYEVRIEDFFKEKRGELVEKICSIKPNDDPTLLQSLKGTLDHLAERRHGLFELSPENIVQYVKFFMCKNADERKGEAVFNVVFETNLRNVIIEQCGEKNIEYCLLVLEEIAYYIHKNKNEQIDFSSIVDLVEELNRNRGLYIDTQHTLDSVLKSNVLVKTDVNNVYAFSNRNYLAYFIAKKLNRLIEKNGLKIPELQYIFTNICFGINDNILLFLSFLRDNTGFALNLCDMLDSLVKEEPELNFDISNVSFIKRQRDVKMVAPTPEDKKKIEQLSDEAERQTRQNETALIQYKGVYDYNEEDVDKRQYRIIRAVKYLEVISKSLISHYVNLELSEKQRIVDLMYTTPNKILYAMFKPIDDHYSELIDGLKQLVDSNDDLDIKLTKSQIEEIFNDTAAAICLSLYDNISFYGTNFETLRLLNAYDMTTSNHRIENLIMEETGGGSEGFVDKAIKLMEQENDSFITNLIRRIAKKHIITKNVDHKIRDRIADKIFPNSPNSTKRQLLLVSMSQRKKNE